MIFLIVVLFGSCKTEREIPFLIDGNEVTVDLANKMIKEGKPTIIRLGKAASLTSCEDEILTAMNLRFINKGCIVTDQILDSTLLFNEATKRYLTYSGFRNWNKILLKARERCLDNNTVELEEKEINLVGKIWKCIGRVDLDSNLEITGYDDPYIHEEIYEIIKFNGEGDVIAMNLKSSSTNKYLATGKYFVKKDFVQVELDSFYRLITYSGSFWKRKYKPRRSLRIWLDDFVNDELSITYEENTRFYDRKKNGITIDSWKKVKLEYVEISYIEDFVCRSKNKKLNELYYKMIN